MMKVRFGEELSRKFIEKYAELEYLWNKQHPLHKSTQAREVAYEELRELVNRPDFTIQDVRNKIRVFRSTYCQELKKIRKSPQQSYHPSLHWFHIMDRVLRKHINMQDKNIPSDDSCDKNVSKIPIVYEEVYVEYDSQTSSKPETNEEYDTISFYSGDEEHQESVVCEEETETEYTEDVKSSKKFVKKDTYDEQLNQSNATTSRKSINKMYSNETEDEFDVFGKSVAIQLRQLCLKDALNTQVKIITLLTQARLNKTRDSED